MLFISSQKLFSFSRYSSFCLDFLFMYRNGKVDFKFYDVTVWLTNNGNEHIAQYLEKYRQSMKFSQLIECNMRNIFLGKSYTKSGGKTNPRPFSEKLKLSIPLDQ